MTGDPVLLANSGAVPARGTWRGVQNAVCVEFDGYAASPPLRPFKACLSRMPFFLPSAWSPARPLRQESERKCYTSDLLPRGAFVVYEEGRGTAPPPRYHLDQPWPDTPVDSFGVCRGHLKIEKPLDDCCVEGPNVGVSASSQAGQSFMCQSRKTSGLFHFVPTPEETADV